MIDRPIRRGERFDTDVLVGKTYHITVSNTPEDERGRVFDNVENVNRLRPEAGGEPGESEDESEEKEKISTASHGRRETRGGPVRWSLRPSPRSPDENRHDEVGHPPGPGAGHPGSPLASLDGIGGDEVLRVFGDRRQTRPGNRATFRFAGSQFPVQREKEREDVFVRIHPVGSPDRLLHRACSDIP